jgi:hypothetical protein
MRIFLFFLFIFILSACESKKINTEAGFRFPSLDYDKVVAYHFEDPAGEHIILKSGVLNSTVKKEQELTFTQIKHFLATINHPDTYGGMTNRCFEPRLGIVFYDKTNKPKAHVSICFQCNNFMSSPNVATSKQAPNSSLGFSEQGRRNLIAFCKSLDFGQCGSLD